MSVASATRRAERRLDARVPLTFRWHSGKTMPIVGREEIVLWEDLDDGVAKILARWKNRLYVFLSVTEDSVEGAVVAQATAPAISGTERLWFDTSTNPEKLYAKMKNASGAFEWVERGRGTGGAQP